MSVKLSSYNEVAYENVKQMLQEKNRVAIIHPRGTEESSIILKLIEENPDKRILYLSQFSSNLDKLQEDIILNGINFGNLERYTYQKLSRRNKKGDFNLYADIIILDKFYHWQGLEYISAVKKLLENNKSAKVFGISSNISKNSNILEGFFNGNIASEITIEEAISNGYYGDLTKLSYGVGIYDGRNILEKLELPQKDLIDLKSILEKSIKEVPNLLEKNIVNKSGKYIVYCTDRNIMKESFERAPEMFHKVNSNIDIMKISFYNGINNEEIIKNFKDNNNENKLKLLFLTNFMGEKYDFGDIDGIITIGHTNQLSNYTQQLGLSLSIRKKSDFTIIDLIDNINMIKIIEEFNKSLEERYSDDSVFSIPEEIIKIKDISEALVKKKRILSDKEKLDLIEDYLKENGKIINKNILYKGYNLKNIINTLRQKYDNGELEYELEKRFTENKALLRRYNKNLLEKYYFLESMFGKSKEELENTKTENGIPFSIIKYQIQSAYNRGELELDLTPKQIRNLMENGMLDYSKEEEAEIIKQSQFSRKDALIISKRYGSFSHFIKEYKECKIDYYFKRNMFHCYRGIALSENDLTEKQKNGYFILLKKILGDKVDLTFVSGSYIDIDKFNEALNTLEEGKRKIIENRYDLKVEKYSLEEIEKSYNKRSITQMENKAFQSLKKMSGTFVGNIIEDKKEYEKKKNDIEDLRTLKSFIVDENGELKSYHDIKDIELIKTFVKYKDGKCLTFGYPFVNIGFDMSAVENVYYDGIGLRSVVRDLTETGDDYVLLGNLISKVADNHCKEINGEKDIKQLGLSGKPYYSLIKAGINDIPSLIQKTEEELFKTKGLGKDGIEEIKEKLLQNGLTLKTKEEINSDIKELNQKKSLNIFLEQINLCLKVYEERLRSLEMNFLRYNIAKDYYLDEEDLFNQSGVIPGVPVTLNINPVENENSQGNNQQVEELLERIRENQKKLMELSQKLSKDDLERKDSKVGR